MNLLKKTINCFAFISIVVGFAHAQVTDPNVSINVVVEDPQIEEGVQQLSDNDKYKSEQKALKQKIELKRADIITRINIDKKNLKLLQEELKISKDASDNEAVGVINQDFIALKEDIDLRQQKAKELKKLNREVSKLQYDDNWTLGLVDLENRFDLIQSNNTEEIVLEKLEATPMKYSFDVDSSDPAIDPPGMKCDVTVTESTDQSKSRIDTKSYFFFDYTHEKLESYFKEKSFMTTNAQLSKVGGYTFLTLDITINSKKAKESYGEIEAGSMLRVQLINGDKIYLKNVSPSAGKLEPYTGYTSYQSIYAMDPSNVSAMLKHEVDTVGIIWSSGFEEYQIYEMDLMQNLINCLKQQPN